MEVDTLSWRPYGRSQPVLRDLTLRFQPGERVLLVGPSGSGKSTLLRAVAGLLLTADAGDLTGSVLVDGTEPGIVAGSVGLVLQDPGAGVVASSVWRDVAFGLENLGMPRDEMAAPVARALAEVGLERLAAAPPGTLSGGEQQRLALAGALAMSPRVLLLDEPTAMLDAENAASVRQVVGDVVRRRGLTTIVVEHRLGPWLDLVDRLVVLGADGSVVADGDPERVLTQRGAALVDAGIWVPGWPDPEPLHLGSLFVGPILERVADQDADRGVARVVDADTAPVVGRTVARGAEVTAARVVDADADLAVHRVVARADDVSVRLTSRPLSGEDRVTTAVRNVDLEVRSGHTMALVGPSGSGKSTLLAVLAGLVPPTTGSVRIDGGPEGPPHRWSSPDLARVVSWVPQRAASAIVRRTVRDEVLATAAAVGVDPEVAGRRADLLLDRLGLAGLADADPRHLSGGEQRRLAVAAAVVHRPSVVLADEPTVGQDRMTWAAVVGTLDAVRASGSAVVVATHDHAVQSRADVVVGIEPTRPGLHDETSPAAPQLPLASDGVGDPGADPQRLPQVPAVVAARTSLAARCGPLSLLLASLLVLPLPALVDSWRQSAVVLGVEAVLGLVALAAPGWGPAPPRRVRRTLRRLAPALVGVVGVAWSTWLLGGHDIEVAAGAGLRVLCLVLPSVLLLPFVDPDALGDHLAQRVRLPARPVVAATAALQRFHAFGALWAEITRARRVRGIGAGRSVLARVREVGSTTLALFVAVLAQASVLALAMDARGFAGAHRRTWAGAAPWRLADTLAVVGGLTVVLAAVIVRTVLAA